MSEFYTILECSFGEQNSEWADKYKRSFIGLTNYPPTGDPLLVRADDIYFAVGMLTLKHLGYPIPVELEEYLAKAVDVAVNYFMGDWWKADKYASEYMDKSKSKKGLKWYATFKRGLLLAMLGERWDAVEMICDWPEADLVAEELLDEKEKVLPHLYKSIAAKLRQRPMPGVEKLEMKILKSDAKQSKLLYAAWDAARRGDREGFSKAFVDSVRFFKKKFGKGHTPIEWVSCHDSVVLLAARRLGMKQPDLPVEYQAVLVTPESIA